MNSGRLFISTEPNLKKINIAANCHRPQYYSKQDECLITYFLKYHYPKRYLKWFKKTIVIFIYEYMFFYFLIKLFFKNQRKKTLITFLLICAFVSHMQKAGFLITQLIVFPGFKIKPNQEKTKGSRRKTRLEQPLQLYMIIFTLMDYHNFPLYLKILRNWSKYSAKVP